MYWIIALIQYLSRTIIRSLWRLVSILFANVEYHTMHTKLENVSLQNYWGIALS